MKRRIAGLLAFVCFVALFVPEILGATRRKTPSDVPSPVAKMFISGSDVWFDPVVSFGALNLTFTRPDGIVQEERFKPGELPYISISPDMPDGVYKYELRVIPGGALRKRTEEENAPAEPSVSPLVQNGSFHVSQGRALTQDTRSPGEVMFDVVQADDVIVQGSLAVGLDAINGESFGFDTIRLKEDNLRIKFDDTSTLAGYPANDWQLTANDSASGGMSYFAIDDVTGAKTPFKVEAGAASNSLYIDSTGRIGLKTATPVLDLHTKTSNTPAFRLEQDSAGGFTAQTWDIAGNEANFFVRDVTGGSRLPFRIRPGAPTSSIDISADGYVGIGTASPDRQLVVEGAQAIGKFRRLSATGPDFGPTFLLERARGPAADIVPGDYLGKVQFRGRVSGLFPEYGAMVFIASDTSQNGRFSFVDRDLFTERMVIYNTGNVGIGTNAPTERLDVNGNLRVRGGIQYGGPVAVPDYVFASDYKLMPLADLARYVKTKKHLPNIPNAMGIQNNGVNLGEFQMKLLEKIEELTLYTLQQEQSNNRLKEEAAGLKERIKFLEEAVKALMERERGKR